MIPGAMEGAGRDIVFDREAGDTLVVSLLGGWTSRTGVPTPHAVEDECRAHPPVGRIRFSTERLEEWDSGLIAFLRSLHRFCEQSGIRFDDDGLPEGARRLLRLATATTDREGAARATRRDPLLARVGLRAQAAWSATVDFTGFLGEATVALFRFLGGRARFRRRDFGVFLEEASAGSLPIVTIINFLVGLILAFVGAIQLRQFGATLYIADLVGIAMAREMGAMMTGIIMAGRTGAAYAAQLGTMTVNEEVDSLRAMGISPMEFLVAPRMVALSVMLPLLTLYGIFIGIAGGAFVGKFMFDISFVQFLEQSRAALEPRHFLLGLIKASVYGMLVAIAGCYRGMRSGRSAAAVGDATTSAVVMSLVMIIVASAILTVVYSVLGV